MLTAQEQIVAAHVLRQARPRDMTIAQRLADEARALYAQNGQAQVQTATGANSVAQQ